ncbi:hypothetical protein PRIC1_002651 [Phytophthora ramorum]
MQTDKQVHARQRRELVPSQTMRCSHLPRGDTTTDAVAPRKSSDSREHSLLPSSLDARYGGDAFIELLRGGHNGDRPARDSEPRLASRRAERWAHLPSRCSFVIVAGRKWERGQ